MTARLIKMLILGIKKLREPYYHGFAAQIAFYYMLSVVPLSLILSQLLGQLFPGKLEELQIWLLDNMSGQLGDQIGNFITYRSAGALNIVYVFIALWASSRGQFALTRIVNYTLTDGKTTGRGFWAERIRSVVTMFLLLLAIVTGIGIMVYGGAIVSFFSPHLNLWLYLRWPAALVVFFFILSFIYYILPMERPRYRDVVPGSIFAGIGLVVVTWAYSFYLARMARFDIIYGALANIVALMFWFFFLAWVLCLGVVINKLIIDTKELPINPFD